MTSVGCCSLAKSFARETFLWRISKWEKLNTCIILQPYIRKLFSFLVRTCSLKSEKENCSFCLEIVTDENPFSRGTNENLYPRLLENRQGFWFGYLKAPVCAELADVCVGVQGSRLVGDQPSVVQRKLSATHVLLGMTWLANVPTSHTPTHGKATTSKAGISVCWRVRSLPVFFRSLKKKRACDSCW